MNRKKLTVLLASLGILILLLAALLLLSMRTSLQLRPFELLQETEPTPEPTVHVHRFDPETHICPDCGETCGHTNGFDADHCCRDCGWLCPHETHDKETAACPVCGAQFNHHFGMDGVCDVCGAERNITHKWSDKYKYDENTHYKECTVCGATIQTGVITALGHAWDAGVITKPATETETGVKTFTCTRCGETKTEVIPKLDGKVNPFVDVPEGKYYYNPVLWAYYHQPYQITGGTDATHFSPGKTCTREQVVSFLYAAYDKPEHHMTFNPFTDVKAGKYYYNAVMWAVENKITGGATETTFGIGKPCTREQVVTFLWKAAGAPAPKSTANPFTDVKAGKYYYNAVLWAVENGITGGATETTFGVGKPCTRAQVVTFLYKAVGEG